jgi:hypothetical protein
MGQLHSICRYRRPLLAWSACPGVLRSGRRHGSLRAQLQPCAAHGMLTFTPGVSATVAADATGV